MIGSVKTNIGHLEAAAGVTGLIKLVLSLRAREIPAHLHFRTPSPHIPWADLPIEVRSKHAPWLPIDGRRIGGVSSFGFSGTNAHVIVEEAPVSSVEPTRVPHACIFTLSARDAEALSAVARRHAGWLAGRGDEELADVCYTSTRGRAHFAHRAAIVASSMPELVASLEALARGETPTSVHVGNAGRGDPPRLAFLFTGQGAQYGRMAQGLYENAPVFREALDRCAAGLANRLDKPLLEVVFQDADRAASLDETGYTQAALFAVEFALTELLRSWGVVPSMAMGHSVGEVVAACVAGVLSFDDGLHLVARRGALMQALPAGGAMAAVRATEAEVATVLAAQTGQVVIAATNAPGQVVISGHASPVSAACEALRARGHRCQPLAVSHAFHSPLVEPMLDEFEREVATMRLGEPRIRMVSNVTGKIVGPGELASARYWRTHVRQPVRFAAGLEALQHLKPDVMLEIGPHPTLLSFASETLGDAAPCRIPTLRRGQDDMAQFLNAIARLYVAGAEIDWRAQAVPGKPPRIVDLPGYPLRRERFWFQATKSARTTFSAAGRPVHPLCGTRLRNASRLLINEAVVSADAPAFLRDHRVQGRVVLPATCYLDALLAFGREVLKSESVVVTDIELREAMLLAEDGSSRIFQIVAEPKADGGYPVSVSSQAESSDADGNWTSHVAARLLRANPEPRYVSRDELAQKCARSVAVADFYADFGRRGLDFGPGFRTIRQLSAADGEALGRIELDAALSRGALDYVIHPVLLDGAVQVLAAALPRDLSEDSLFLPVGVGRFELWARPASGVWSHARVVDVAGDNCRAEIILFDDSGLVVAELRHVQLRRVSRDALARLDERSMEESLYVVDWIESALPSKSLVSLPSPAALCAAMDGAQQSLSRASGIDAYDRFLPGFDALCADYTVQAFHELGWRPAVGEIVEPAMLASKLGIGAAHRRLVARLLAILAEIGILARDDSTRWRVIAPLPEARPTEALQRLRANCPPGAEAELEMTVRVASEFAPVLRGEREPMQLLFPGGSLETAERMYRDSPTAIFFNGLLAQVLRHVCTARTQGRRLRILEVGGGTGGSTAHVLPHLPAGDIEYTFTDVGPLFVARARERFGSRPGTRFEVFDLEQPATAQAISGMQFDVVIAANVIHATADLRGTLANIRGLMAPGALLAMLEVTAPQRWFDLTVGLTPGWWAFTDLDLRSDYATLDRATWSRLLLECGFESTSALPGADAHSASLSLQSLFLAQVPSAASRRWLVLDDDGGGAKELCDRLRARGDHCTRVVGGHFRWDRDVASLDAAAPGDWRAMLAASAADGVEFSDVVHSALLGSPVDEMPDLPSVLSRERTGPVAALSLAQAALSAGSRAPTLDADTRRPARCGRRSAAGSDRRHAVGPGAIATAGASGVAGDLHRPRSARQCRRMGGVPAGIRLDRGRASGCPPCGATSGCAPVAQSRRA